MNTNLPSNGFDLWLVAGWTMIHFLWLGTFVGLVALCSRWLFRRASASTRYAMGISWLILLAALPVAIATWLATTSPPLKGGQWRVTSSQAGGGTSADIPEQLAPTTPSTIELHAASPPSAPGFAGGFTGNHDHSSTALSAETTTNPRQSRGLPELQSPLMFATAVDQLAICIPYLPWLWLIGTPITFALTATGLIGTRRLRRASRPITDGPIAEALEKLAVSLRITRRVAVAVCDRIAAPVLIGILRPIILLPPAALTGYSPDEIEMVLLHELAHVRRWDNLVNLVQRLIESVLFFHPAVWLISSWIRREREACCDALVVTRTDRPHAYAELLVALAAQMPRSVLFHPAASSAMAAGPLRSRIRRILKLDDDPMLISGKSLAIVIGGLLVAATLAVLYLPTIGQAEQSATEAIENAEKSQRDSNVAGEGGQEGSRENQTRKNMKQLVIALHNFHDGKGVFPPHAIYDTNARPLLSWRVSVLPYLGEKALYDEFHLDEPWDSPHNKTLIARMPKVFMDSNLKDIGRTNYLAVVGKECVFDGSPKGMRVSGITDGASNTITMVEANADQSVEWTKPADLKYDPEHPKSGVGSLRPQGWYAGWADGRVSLISNDVNEQFAKAIFTRATESAKATTLRERGFSYPLPMKVSDEDARRIVKEVLQKQEIHAARIEPSQPMPDAQQVIFGDFVCPEGTDPNVQWRTDAKGKLHFTIDFIELPGAHAATQTASLPQGHSRFPTLEDQKLADLAWKRLGLELEPVGEADLKRVKALGYDGGLRLAGPGNAAGTAPDNTALMWQSGDILVGLHVWPTTNLKDVGQVLARDDLNELNPLKFYAVTSERVIDPNQTDKTIMKDRVRTGRINVRLDESPSSHVSVKLPESGVGTGGQFPSRSDYFYKSTSHPPTPINVERAEKILKDAVEKRDAALKAKQEALTKKSIQQRPIMMPSPNPPSANSKNPIASSSRPSESSKPPNVNLSKRNNNLAIAMSQAHLP